MEIDPGPIDGEVNPPFFKALGVLQHRLGLPVSANITTEVLNKALEHLPPPEEAGTNP